MCGIVGRAGPLEYADELFFKALILLDFFRGQDSTGIATIRATTKEVSTLKIADDPIMLMQHQDFETTLNGTSDLIWIGHNRASTIGASTRANAHPFTHDHITGVHNGTLTKASIVDLDSALSESFGTDSETIFAHIAKYGVEETIPKLQGAWALVWYDAKEDTLNMIRNKERPLYICETEITTGNLLSWASDWKMLSAARTMAAERGSLVTDKEGYSYFPLETDILHVWNGVDLAMGITEVTETTPMKGRDPAPKVFTAGYGGSGSNSTLAVKEVVDDPVVITLASSGDKADVTKEFTEDEWNEMVKYGCSWCGSDIEPEDKGLLIHPDEGVILCPSCSGEEETTIATCSLGVNSNLV